MEEVKDFKKPSKLKRIVFIVVQSLIILVCVAGAIFIMINPKLKKDDPKDFNPKMMVVETDSMDPTLKQHTMMFSSKFEYDENTVLDLGTVISYYIKNGDKYSLITHRIVGYYYYNGVINSNSKVYGDANVKSFSNIKEKYNDNVEFIGYLTRGDKYTLEYGATLEDYAIRNEDNSINYGYDDVYYAYVTNDLIVSTWSGKQSNFLGKVVTFLSKPNNVMLCLVLPIILLIIYNMLIVIKDIVNDKRLKAKEEALKQFKIEQLDEEEIKRKAIEEYLASLENKDEE